MNERVGYLFQCGAETFLRLFEQHPDTKAIFRKFQGLDLVALEQSIEIKEHGGRVSVCLSSRAFGYLPQKNLMHTSNIYYQNCHFCFQNSHINSICT